MNDIHIFLAHAIRLEADAARRYEQLADEMRTFGNTEVEAFFRQMARFSRQHLADATARGGFRAVPTLEAAHYCWPEGTSPEAAAWAGVDAFLDVGHALTLALDAEQRGHAFYAAVAAATTNPRVRAMATEFAAEEAQHVIDLETRVARLKAPAP